MWACEGGAVADLIQSYRDRGWDEMLAEFTPCQLFELIKGRTVWMMGDSQNGYFYA